MKREIIEYIYKNSILTMGTRLLKSGEYTDHYYNFGNIYSTDELNQIGGLFLKLINVSFDCIFTSAYKGILISSAILHEYCNPVKIGYLRKEDKDHGEEGKVVGFLPKKGNQVILIDDVFTTGKSLVEMYTFLRYRQVIPVGAFVVVSRATDKELKKVDRSLSIPIRYMVHDDEVIKEFDNLWLGSKNNKNNA